MMGNNRHTLFSVRPRASDFWNPIFCWQVLRRNRSYRASVKKFINGAKSARDHETQFLFDWIRTEKGQELDFVRSRIGRLSSGKNHVLRLAGNELVHWSYTRLKEAGLSLDLDFFREQVLDFKGFQRFQNKHEGDIYPIPNRQCLLLSLVEWRVMGRNKYYPGFMSKYSDVLRFPIDPDVAHPRTTDLRDLWCFHPLALSNWFEETFHWAQSNARGRTKGYGLKRDRITHVYLQVNYNFSDGQIRSVFNRLAEEMVNNRKHMKPTVDDFKTDRRSLDEKLKIWDCRQQGVSWHESARLVWPTKKKDREYMIADARAAFAAAEKWIKIFDR